MACGKVACGKVDAAGSIQRRLRVALAALLAGTSAAAAAQTITLKVADSLPVGHYVTRYQTKPWMEEVTAQTNGRVKFDYFPAEQLGKAKDLLSLTQAGVADIAFVVPAFVPDKMPYSPVAELPIAEAVGCRGAMAYYRLVNRDSQLRKLDYDNNKVRPLFVQNLPPYQVFTAKKIGSLAEMKGMKIRTSGTAKQAVMQKLGAVPVNIPTPEVREALARGTVDGVLFVYSSMFPYDMQGLVKSATTEANFGGWISSYLINEDKWKSLPADVQQVMMRAAEKVTRSGCDAVMKDDLTDRARLAAGGTTIFQLSDADRAEFEKKTASVAEDWAKELDRRGRPGSAVLKEYREALKAQP